RHADALLGQASAHVLIFQLPAAEPAIAHPILESRITQTTGSSKALACALALRQRAKLVRLTTSRQSRDIRATPFQIRLKVLRCPAQQHGADRLLLGLGTNVMEARDGATLVAAGAAGSVQPTYERLGGPDTAVPGQVEVGEVRFLEQLAKRSIAESCQPTRRK